MKNQYFSLFVFIMFISCFAYEEDVFSLEDENAAELIHYLFQDKDQAQCESIDQYDQKNLSSWISCFFEDDSDQIG